MTQEDFLAFYPQFDHLFPPAVLADALSRANARFADFGADREPARRLFAAHLLTLYAFTAAPEGAEPSLLLLSSAGRNRSSRPVASGRSARCRSPMPPPIPSPPPPPPWPTCRKPGSGCSC